MDEFLDVARDQLALSRVDNAKEDFERVFSAISALKVVHSNSRLDFENIETLFAACEMAKTLGRFPGSANPGADIDKLLHSLRRLIVRTLESTLRFSVTRRANALITMEPPVPYAEFAALLRRLRDTCTPTHTIAVLTFNYDIAADFAMELGACPPDYALDDGPAKGSKHVPLLKLHGSMSWGLAADDATRVIPLPLGKIYSESTFYSHSDGPFFWKVSENLRLDTTTTGEPVLVPPTWNKADSHRSLEKVWSRAAKELSEAENIFVMGYSMPETDSFFRHLYALGTVGDKTLRRFWVFNPNADLERRFRELLGPGANRAFQFFQKTFREGIGYLHAVF